MAALIADTETNGLLPALDRIHSLVLRDYKSSELVMSCAVDTETNKTPAGYKPMEQGLEVMADTDLLLGHNLIEFDIPAIQKVYPGWDTKARLRDTLYMARVAWADRLNDDIKAKAKGKLKGLPPKLLGRHSLEAWGYRLNLWKGDYSAKMKEQGIDPWAAWRPEMQVYCEGDTEVTLALARHIARRGFSQDCWDIEHTFQILMNRQRDFGIHFDEERAAKLYAELAGKRDELRDELLDAFQPWWAPAGKFTPKRPNKTRGYEAGVEFTKVKLTEFNPDSRDHIANRFKALYNWKPTEFTPGGKPKIDETVVSGLTFPEAEPVGDYLTIARRISQLADGKGALMRSSKDGMIHGTVNSAGTVTGRCSHNAPNIAQIPKVKTRKVNGKTEIVWGYEGNYGADFRALFYAPPGYKMVGADASGLELRCLAHYMSRYDDGEYVKLLLEDDIHSVHARALGLDPAGIYTVNGQPRNGRDIAKTFIYAFLYGAGDEKLGKILGKGRATGKELRAKFMQSLPALRKLIEKVKATAKKAGCLVGIDGRKLDVRSPHAALNTLLQSAGGIVVKKATLIAYADIAKTGLEPWVDFANVAHIHDEIQQIAKEEHAELVGQTTADAMRHAGEHFEFRCPLAGEYKVGRTWAETH